MDLRCPKCRSTDLKKASLAHQEGLFRVDTRTRILGFLFASGGPDVLVGSATTRGVQQSALSKSLAPPTKWSYLKLILWSAAISFVALIAYVPVVMTSPPPVSSLPVKIYSAVAPLVFIFLLFRSGGTIIQLTGRNTQSGTIPISASGVAPSANKHSVKILSRRCSGQLMRSFALDMEAGSGRSSRLSSPEATFR